MLSEDVCRSSRVFLYAGSALVPPPVPFYPSHSHSHSPSHSHSDPRCHPFLLLPCDTPLFFSLDLLAFCVHLFTLVFPFLTLFYRHIANNLFLFVSLLVRFLPRFLSSFLLLPSHNIINSSFSSCDYERLHAVYKTFGFFRNEQPRNHSKDDFRLVTGRR